VGKRGSKFDLFGTLFARFSLREMAGILYLTNHWDFSLHCFAMIFFWYKNFKAPKITQFGAVGGQI